MRAWYVMRVSSRRRGHDDNRQPANWPAGRRPERRRTSPTTLATHSTGGNSNLLEYQVTRSAAVKHPKMVYLMWKDLNRCATWHLQSRSKCAELVCGHTGAEHQCAQTFEWDLHLVRTTTTRTTRQRGRHHGEGTHTHVNRRIRGALVDLRQRRYTITHRTLYHCIIHSKGAAPKLGNPLE